jgi:hypothetical protein
VFSIAWNWFTGHGLGDSTGQLSAPRAVFNLIPFTIGTGLGSCGFFVPLVVERDFRSSTRRREVGGL